jgi:8-oxo-dGTP pyrophosphatase MutT (NUDIX family)
MSAAPPDQNIETVVAPVAQLELAFAQRAWPFALKRRDEIDAPFAALTARSCSESWPRLPPMPGGSTSPPEFHVLSDVEGARVDLARSLVREVKEETGLAAAELDAQAGWTTVLAGARIAQIKILQGREPAASLRARILSHLARDAQPELADMRVVGGPGDFDPMMPPYVRAFLMHVWK